MEGDHPLEVTFFDKNVQVPTNVVYPFPATLRILQGKLHTASLDVNIYDGNIYNSDTGRYVQHLSNARMGIDGQDTQYATLIDEESGQIWRMTREQYLALVRSLAGQLGTVGRQTLLTNPMFRVGRRHR